MQVKQYVENAYPGVPVRGETCLTVPSGRVTSGGGASAPRPALASTPPR